jgi:hypothetical protein
MLYYYNELYIHVNKLKIKIARLKIVCYYFLHTLYNNYKIMAQMLINFNYIDKTH